MKPTLSFIIPAYNEERHLRITVTETLKVLKEETSGYEVIIVDDGSSDGTGQVADELARDNPHVKVVHHPRNLGFGFACRHGVERATKDFLCWVPSDTTWDPQRLAGNIQRLGRHDMIITYLANFHEREWYRRLISAGFTAVVNGLFGLHMKYYNGCSFFRTRLIQSLPFMSEGFTLWAEAIVRLAKSGCTYEQIPAPFEERKFGKTKAFRPKNIADTLRFLAGMVRDICFRRGRLEKISS